MLLSGTVFRAIAQGSPQGINYQAVARDNTGNILANKNINVRFEITGSLTFTEQHSTTTNKFWLFNLVIGKGTQTSTSSFSAINWGSAPHFLEVFVDYNGSGFLSLGKTQLMSVPYALYAGNALPGATGPTGIAGTNGTNGATGPTGATGLTGIAGTNGATGATGATGLTGIAGTNGATGATGPTGATGLTGIAGTNGTNGATGSTGAMGPIGATGPTGIAGTNGTNGATGATG
ncbi:MAG: collagen-like protein, partial [Bacteroidia bacterium]|nr:collagen-like protein [Bacteroidia bacterium]